MISVSVCMIVKNEEENIAECLDCFKEFADEIIIVDTGSDDKTKEIASAYTDKIYDFEWIDDFAAARNYSFSKATMEYIYVADADERIDDTNQRKLKLLKQVMLPEIEIVQMKYTNQLEYGTTYNFDIEYRGKMYKRVRSFSWIDPIHETVNIDPVVYDSDIEIIHTPHECHAQRDFELYKRVISKGKRLSPKLINMYAKELFIAGQNKNFSDAAEYFDSILNNDDTSSDTFRIAACVAIRAARIDKRWFEFFETALKITSDNPPSEVCYDIAEYHFSKNNIKEAIIWYYNAAKECSPILNIHYGSDYPLKKMAECYRKIEDIDLAEEYERQVGEFLNKK